MKATRNRQEKPPKKSGDKPSDKPPVKTRLKFDHQVAKDVGDIKTVPLGQIHRQDQAFQFRDSICPPCNPCDYVVEDGVVDGATGVHPIVLQSQSKNGPYRIVSGFGRLDIMPDNDEITSVRCFVLRNMTAAEVTILAARANLSHGQALSIAERRRCFRKEVGALEIGDYERPSISALGRAYAVSRNTIKRWLEPSGPQSQSTRERRRQEAAVETTVGAAKPALSPTDEKGAEPADPRGEEASVHRAQDAAGPGVGQAIATLRAAIDTFLDSVARLRVPEPGRKDILEQADRIRDYINGIPSDQRGAA